MSIPASFPGGTSVSVLQVYDDAAADGLRGGSPHVHLASTEAYIVTGGRGRLQTVSAQGFQETALRPGSIVWFTPGTIHRAVNDGDLSAVVLMSNAGLPEAGDAVLTFPPDIVASPTSYAGAVDLGAGGDDERREQAARRRDLAVEGFLLLRAAAERGDPGPLHTFLRAATDLVRDRARGWGDLIDGNALAIARRDLQVSERVAAGDAGHLESARVQEALVAGVGVLGMCGLLQKYDTRGVR